jgi:hypothetical protein
MLKIESKDLILVWVWHRDRVHLLSLACWESAVYDHVDGLVLLSFSYLGFALMLFCKFVFSLPPGLSHF